MRNFVFRKYLIEDYAGKAYYKLPGMLPTFTRYPSLRQKPKYKNTATTANLPAFGRCTQTRVIMRIPMTTFLQC